MLRRLSLVLALMATGAAPVGAQPNAAHDLAQKFSGVADAKSSDIKSSETSKAKSAVQPVLVVQKPADAAQVAPQVKPFAKSDAAPAAASMPAPTPPKVAATERPPLDYEMDMLRRARAEEADRKAAIKPAAPITGQRIVVQPPVVAAEPAKGSVPPVAAAVATPVVAPPVPSAEKPEPAAAKTEPATAAAVKTEPAKIEPAKVAPAKLVEAQPAPAAATPAVQAKADAPVSVPPPPTPTPAPSAALPAVQASVLLAIETGGVSTKGDTQTLDPIICVADSCYISAGLTADAVKLSKGDALKLKSSKDASPDACRGMVGCVFRNVGFAKDALIQVVDLGTPSSGEVQTYVVQPDGTCKSSDGALSCDNPIATSDFRIWIVPEATAKSAGEQSIEDAVADSLPHKNIARDTDK
ncbi:MAG TPA: hypothetical protein PLD46_06365 [Hyphomicrobium sp.]|nr:hypothetical protein [Hyphomicrobium sp.]